MANVRLRQAGEGAERGYERKKHNDLLHFDSLFPISLLVRRFAILKRDSLTTGAGAG
jgi:hypothetical protein